MPSRIIKESITTSDTLARVSGDAERLFWRLVVLADDYGRYDARPLIILGKGFAAMLDTVKAKDIERWMDELEGSRLVRRYTVEGHFYLWITTWDTHQQTRAARSKYPQPPADDGSCLGLLASDCNGNQPLAHVPVSVSVSVSENESGIRAAKAADPHISEAFQYYQLKIQPNARLIDAAKAKIKTRLEHFKIEELKLGIDNFAADGWRMENNSHEGAPWFFASDARSEKFLNIVPNSKPANSNSHTAPIPLVARTPESRSVDEVCTWEKG